MNFHPLKDLSIPRDRRLGRVVQFDDRSRAFCVSDIAPAKIVTVEWKCDQWLDQVAEGACVGFGITHEAIAYPVPVKGLNAKFARERIYWEAQRNDGMPGGSYPGAFPRYEGTSVLAGLKAYKKTGLIDGYLWAFGLDEMLRGIAKGPCVLGIPWLKGMMKPDPNGLIHATGPRMGGHCILATGLDITARTVTLHNSWGTKWGRGGNCFVSWEDMSKLLDDDGEAAFVQGRHLTPKQPRGKR